MRRKQHRRGRGYGPDYGVRRERGGGRILAVLSVILLSAGLGIGAYLFSKNNLSERRRLVPIPEEIREELMNSVAAEEDEIIEGIRSLFMRSGLVPSGWEERVAVSRASIEPQEIREIWMEDFVDTRTPVEAKGIYVTASRAQSDIDSLIELVERTELNAMVIDIKDDDGYITYQMDYDLAQEIGAVTRYISDIEELVSKLKDKGIYLIARIVAFKDPVLADAMPELALKNQDGSIFRDNSGQAWVNPYKTEVWDYLVGVAKEAARIGFNEINFDYIRFSTDSGMSDVDFGEEAEEVSKIETITAFVKYACEQLRPCGVYISADVYGAIITSSVDARIVGQSYMDMSRYLDYICPMVYPSHYGDGYYNLDHPDLHPYELVLNAMQDSAEVIAQIPEDEHRATVRPWLQDFTASWLRYYQTYEAEEVREQIDAVYDSGYSEWLLWNGVMNYTEEALLPDEGDGSQSPSSEIKAGASARE